MRDTILTIPNILSFSRLPLALAVIPYFGTTLGLFLLVVGILTDAADGNVARMTGQTSKIGAILDPIFDRIFVLIIFLTAYELYALPVYSLSFFLRDIISSVATMFHWFGLFALPIELKAHLSGKLITCIQFATLIIVFFGDTDLLNTALFWLNVAFVYWVIDTIILLRRTAKK